MPTTSAIDNEITKPTLNRVLSEPSFSIDIQTQKQLLRKSKTNQEMSGSSEEFNKITKESSSSANEAERNLVFFDLTGRSDQLLREEMMGIQGNCLVQLFQFFLSQCENLDGRVINTSAQFEAYLAKLDGPYDRVNWKEFNETLDQEALYNDPELGKFIDIVFGAREGFSEYVDSFEPTDIILFRSCLNQTESPTFTFYKDEWTHLANFIEKNYDICINQRSKLIELGKIQ